MYINEGMEGLRRRIDEARKYASEVEPFSPRLADALRREASLIETAMPALNEHGVSRATGMLHGLSYAAVIALEQRTQ